jgi:hypothetical protein
MHVHRSAASGFITSVSPEPFHPSLLRRLLAVLAAVAMIWQGIEAARGALPGHIDSQASVAATATSADHDMAADLCGDSTCGDHMQHHATATLDLSPSVRVGRLTAERIVFDSGVTPSADANTPLRPPKTTPTVLI